MRGKCWRCFLTTPTGYGSPAAASGHHIAWPSASAGTPARVSGSRRLPERANQLAGVGRLCAYPDNEHLTQPEVRGCVVKRTRHMELRLQHLNRKQPPEVQ